MTHDLLRNIITEMGCQVNRISVTDLIDNTFYAVIEISDRDNNITSIDARPSDAIALALRTDCPIFVAQKVIDISNASSQPQSRIDDSEDTTKPLEEWPDLIG
jgi:hypothetical protein